MCAKVFLVARRIKLGWWALLVLFVVACATSPNDQLNQAESLLIKLENSGADAYLTYELASARRQLEEARKFIRKNRFELASQYLNRVCQTLDSCGVAFLQKRQVAQHQCEQRLSTLLIDITNLGGMMTSLPRQSYIDQNRYDIYTHRLRRYREEVEILQKLMGQQDFPTALQRSARLEFQVKQSLASLAGSTPIPQQVANRNPSATPAPSASLVAHTARTGGSR